MESNLIRMKHGSNIYYIECFDDETIEDLRIILAKKYNFRIDEEMELYQGNQKLDSKQKINTIDNKKDIKISGAIKYEIQKKQEETITTYRNYIEEFRQMGFNYPDEFIIQLLIKNNYKVEAVIVQLFKSKKSKRKKEKSKK